MNKNQEIQEFLLKKIQNHEYEPGSKIPTEAELITMFGVSRMTVNKVLSTLRNKGYLYSVRGKGTFVKRETVHKNLNELTSFTEEMRSRGIEPITRTLEFSFTTVGYEEEKTSMALEPKDSVYKIVRVRYNEDAPMALDVTFLNARITGPIEFARMGSSLYEFLKNELGIHPQYAVQKIRAIKADEFLAEHLEIPLGDPVLKISNVTYDQENRPVEVVHTFYVHDAYEFEQVSTKS